MEIRGLRTAVGRVSPYVYGIDQYEKDLEDILDSGDAGRWIRLGSNENNYAPYPAALQAMRAELANLNRYPDVAFNSVKGLLSEIHGLAADHIAISHGAEGMLQTLGKCFIEADDEVLIPQTTYGLYREISLLMGGRVIRTPMRDRAVDTEALIAAVTPRTKLVWLANPNNPTGTLVPAADLERLLDALPPHAWLVLDEAYAEFADPARLPDRAALIRAERRLVCVRTFSKAYGLAGARLGYALAHPGMVTVIDTVSEPFNANRIGVAGALAVLTEDRQGVDETLAVMRADRARIETGLAALGCSVVPSQANFVLFETPYDGDALTRELFRRGMVIRSCSGWGYDRAVRVTVGTTEQVTRFLDEMRRLLADSGWTETSG